MKKTGFTLMEVIISCGILALFMTGVMTLYSSGGKIGNTTMWLQNTTNRLKIAARQINASVNKSAYPSVMAFPNQIRRNENEAFKVRYRSGTITSGSSDQIFLKVTEAIPAKTGKGDSDAVLSYHVYTLTSDGELVYNLYNESVAPGDVLTLSNINTSSSKYKAVLVKDVESINCEEVITEKNRLLKVTINCHMPHSETRRSEEAVAVPNVDMMVL